MPEEFRILNVRSESALIRKIETIVSLEGEEIVGGFSKGGTYVVCVLDSAIEIRHISEPPHRRKIRVLAGPECPGMVFETSGRY